MKAENISLIIDNICKKLGVDYCSTNPHLVTLQEDAQKLAKIYLQLKIILGIIQEIEERHEINGLRVKFEQLIKELEEADHIVIRLARELKDKDA
jgi:hypothetical protein